MAARLIHCWSGPRCCSTALMYSFAQRADCAGNVWDEPLYAAYLTRTNAKHPLRDETLAAMADYRESAAVIAEMERRRVAASRDSVLFMKHMSKHVDDVRRDALLRMLPHSFLLVREPRKILLSFGRGLRRPASLDDTGLKQQVRLLELAARANLPTLPVVRNEQLLAAPEATLRALCARLGVSFDARMLRWPAGPKPYDGAWAPAWYLSSHTTTSFRRAMRHVDEDELDVDDDDIPVSEVAAARADALYNRVLEAGGAL